MRLVDDSSTSPTLLREVSDWQDHPAWVSFRDRYDPLLRGWCRGFGLDDDSIDEVCQRIWIELADRMKTFHYDPNRTFRGWLRRLCESRVVDFLRQRQAVCSPQPSTIAMTNRRLARAERRTTWARADRG